MEDTNPSQKNNLKNKKALMTVAVVVILFAFGGFYYLGTQSKSSKSNLSPTPSPKTTPTLKEEIIDNTTSIQKQTTSTPTPTETPTPTQMVFSVTGASAAVDPQSFNGECPKRFNFTGTITVNAAGSVTYHWARSDGTSTPNKVLNFAEAGTNAVDPIFWELGASGENRWREIVVTAPNSTSSNRATFTLTCTD